MKLIGYGIALVVIVLSLMSSMKSKEAPEGVIPEGYERSLEKAQGVEQTLQDSAQKRLDGLESGG